MSFSPTCPELELDVVSSDMIKIDEDDENEDTLNTQIDILTSQFIDQLRKDIVYRHRIACKKAKMHSTLRVNINAYDDIPDKLQKKHNLFNNPSPIVHMDNIHGETFTKIIDATNRREIIVGLATLRSEVTGEDIIIAENEKLIFATPYTLTVGPRIKVDGHLYITSLGKLFSVTFNKTDVVFHLDEFINTNMFIGPDLLKLIKMITSEFYHRSTWDRLTPTVAVAELINWERNKNMEVMNYPTGKQVSNYKIDADLRAHYDEITEENKKLQNKLHKLKQSNNRYRTSIAEYAKRVAQMRKNIASCPL